MSKATRTRKPKSKAQDDNDFVITDENPKYCTYKNPPGMKYVEAETTDEKGKTQIGLHCITIDQLERIRESEK